MHIEGGATAAYRREIESAPDPEAARREIEGRLQAIASPFRTAEAFNIEDIIDPRDTRPMLCDFIEPHRTSCAPSSGPAPSPTSRDTFRPPWPPILVHVNFGACGDEQRAADTRTSDTTPHQGTEP